MRIALFGNIYRSVLLSHVQILFEYFESKDVVLLLNKELYEFVSEHGACDMTRTEIILDDNFEADIALSIGGDGTFLNTAARIGRKQIPILGINTGRLGFLADVSTEEIVPALDAVLAKKYSIQDRTLLAVETSDGTAFDYPYALNEVSVLKQDSSSMMSITASVNGEKVHTYHADGLLVSTPTGSTAYSMSVGGPLVVPEAGNFILSPIASHSLNVRPLIVPDTWTFELEVSSRSQCYLVALDGRSMVLDLSTKLKITKADYTIKVIKQLNHTFFDTLKNKLMWGVDKRN
ncbi:ATP-NAD/AcoX kinase [Paludibacter propionicigenes WB4]|uniref:NAD kinase n=1 Tax=Paludibacter propionicigenes (strain DSM 17365 / JCM 13257 / WB4) TaxID=694427 RepID=E4T8F0_PALPW|nr:NAD kinase [Paludibacter propionicigenes]ADQ80994.1 ATP-NAD/AcoX kinase [Paludibacter propionicigenes WB4]